IGQHRADLGVDATARCRRLLAPLLARLDGLTGLAPLLRRLLGRRLPPLLRRWLLPPLLVGLGWRRLTAGLPPLLSRLLARLRRWRLLTPLRWRGRRCSWIVWALVTHQLDSPSLGTVPAGL
ncbi:MAG TPA: hypothetical protein VMM13_20920, partial [Euzebya sp.]|nr:hypothetical protein [Euzebya sp.]